MPMRNQDICQSYSGYLLRDVPAEDSELTHVRPTTPMGELLRRSWHPVCLTQQLGDLPLAVRLLGEDLVAYRDRSGQIGLLHRHCSHRGTSLEFGIVSDRGLRCCYHGWLFDHDGAILETPGEPSGSNLKASFNHGAYPAVEHRGLVFAYLGPPATKPPLPQLDTLETLRDQLVPFSLWHPCNWLQVLENFMDPIHTIFLHSDYAEIQLSEAYAARPELHWEEVDGGMICVSTRRLDADYVWVRTNHLLLPNFVQVGTLYEDGKEKNFSRAGITRWVVPHDDTHCSIIGWRHFNEVVPSLLLGDPEECGVDQMDAVGQSGGRSPEETQRNPGDWDVMVSQRPIAIHALEHAGTTDQGVMMLRRNLRMAARGENQAPLPLHEKTGAINTQTQDTVMRVRTPEGTDERQHLRELCKRVTNIIASCGDLEGESRLDRIRKGITSLVAE
ncbi:MAG: (Fe-S)-binding protein [Alphaproteobacteria bacterium]|nr:(Fe-S)-binding protein [Alphaproteobacteria bacterium]|tara:strand:- start:8768 stop:10102 length:1335 start_codon:yes stop_codon:yes gene_type:complete